MHIIIYICMQKKKERTRNLLARSIPTRTRQRSDSRDILRSHSD